MKTVSIENVDNFNARMILMEMLKIAPQGINISDMRKRVRVLDVLDKAKDNTQIELEDADYDTLRDVINSGTYSVATPEILKILDNVLKA